MEKRVEKIEARRDEGMGERGENGDEVGMKQKLVELKRQVEYFDKESRKRNIVVKEVKMEKKDGLKEMEKLMADIGAKVNIRGIKGRGGEDRNWPGVWAVELGNEDEKREVMELKKKLRGRKKRILEDRTSYACRASLLS